MSRETDRILAECANIREDIAKLATQSNRLDIYIHFPSATQGGSLERIEAQLATILTKENQQMALNEELLAKITAQTTVIDGIKALIDDWVDGNVLTDAQAAELRAALDGNTAKLEAALAAGTAPPPTP